MKPKMNKQLFLDSINSIFQAQMTNVTSLQAWEFAVFFILSGSKRSHA